MKKSKVIMAVVLIALQLFLVPIHAENEEELPNSQEEAIAEETRRLENMVDSPGVYPTVIRYQIDGQIVEQVINLRIIDTPINEVFEENQEHLKERINNGEEEDFWGPKERFYMQVFQVVIIIFVIILVVAFLTQFISIEVLLKEITELLRVKK